MELPQQYEDALKKVAERYGNESIAMLASRLTILSLLLKERRQATELGELCETIVGQYNRREGRREKVEKEVEVIIEDNFKSYRFSQKTYNEKYAKANPFIEDSLIRIKSREDLFKCRSDHWYIFALTTEELVLLDYPMTPTQLVINRNDYLINGIPAVHPMLLYNNELTCSMVGELSFVFQDNEPIAAIVNNKSGHYRPNQEDLDVVETYLIKKLKVEEIVKLPIE